MNNHNLKLMRVKKTAVSPFFLLLFVFLTTSCGEHKIVDKENCEGIGQTLVLNREMLYISNLPPEAGGGMAALYDYALVNPEALYMYESNYGNKPLKKITLHPGFKLKHLGCKQVIPTGLNKSFSTVLDMLILEDELGRTSYSLSINHRENNSFKTKND